MSTDNNISDDQALEALLSSAQSNQERKERAQNNGKLKKKRWDTNRDNNHKVFDAGDGDGKNTNGRNSFSNEQSTKRRRRWDQDHRDRKEDESKYQWGSTGAGADADDAGGTSGEKYSTESSTRNNDHRYQDRKNSENAKSKECNDVGEEDLESATEKQKPNFGLSGALAEDDKTGNMYNGVLLRFTEPPEARTPNTKWRLYVFKKKSNNNGSSNGDKDDSGDLIQTLHISKQSAYLFGRERKVADVPVDHPSLSKQHCVLQYRALPDMKQRGTPVLCKPYLIDLGSTNGTFINGVRIEDARYYELRKGDVITLGASTREYVLLTEHTTASDL